MLYVHGYVPSRKESDESGTSEEDTQMYQLFFFGGDQMSTARARVLNLKVGHACIIVVYTLDVFVMLSVL